METTVKYAHYNPGHIDSTSRAVRSDDMDRTKELEDTLLKVYQNMRKIAGEDYVPASVREKVDFLVLMTNPWDLDGEQVENIDKVSLNGFRKDEVPPEEPTRGLTGNSGLDSVLGDLAKSGTKIIGVPPGKSITIGVGNPGCGRDVASSVMKVKFARAFTGKDGKKYEPKKTYKFNPPSSFSSNGRTFQWDPDCMDEVSRYIGEWMRGKLCDGLRYVYSHGDDYGMDEEDDEDCEDGWDSFDGIKGASIGVLKKAGSKYRGLEVDHSGNSKLTEYCCEGWKDDESIAPFYVLNARSLIEELC